MSSRSNPKISQSPVTLGEAVFLVLSSFVINPLGLRGRRDGAILGLLRGCELRRSRKATRSYEQFFVHMSRQQRIQ